MKIIVRLVLLLVLAALGYWLYTVLFPSPETVIRQRLQTVAKLASFTGQEGNLARLANVQQLIGFFSTAVEVRVDSPAHAEHTFSGKDEIQQVLLGIRTRLGGLEVKFLDPQVQLNPDETNATVQVTAEARVAGERDLFIQELQIGFTKNDGKWLIARIETVRTLK
jgi:hypothetical protein